MMKRGKVRKRNKRSIGCMKERFKEMDNGKRDTCSVLFNRMSEHRDHECD
jgi:hypothetical protein